jgi:hypothetical protein
MALRESGARYKYGLSRLRIRAKNDDLTIPTPSNMVGGAGPFDFSSASAPAKVPFTVKIDGNAAVSGTIDLSADTISAITVAQWVTAMTAGLTAAGLETVTASKDATTGRAKLASSTGAYVQFYGLAASLARFGQGRGLKAVKSDTAKSLAVTPKVKDDTTETVTDANLKDTEVIVSGYKKGWTGTLTDTVEDFEMMELLESGTIDSSGAYTDPDSSTVKVEVEIETWNPLYAAGTNTEDEIVGWQHEHFMAVKGSVGDETKQAGFIEKKYTLVGTNYKDASGNETGAIVRERLAVTAWDPDAFDAI